MDIFISLITAIVIGSMIAFPVFYYFVYEPLRIFFRWCYHILFSRLSISDALYLEKNFSFYHGLSEFLKSRFEKRVASFLRYKKFVGVDVEVTDEMKLFVSAVATQLTFGLRNFWLTEFDEIRLHKDEYQLRGFEQKALGHVSGSGVISLSWNDLQEGFENPDDAINVGLHEMAHALYLSSVEKGWNIDFAVEYKDWEKEAVIEWKKGKEQGKRTLREYAYGNLYEFFAVCVEYFFEKSQALQAAAPNLYVEMERLLRLDPLNHSDPILRRLPVLFPSQTIPLPEYHPGDLFRKIFASPKNLICFFAGSFCWALGIFLLFISVQFDALHPNAHNPFLAGGKLSGFIFFIAVFFYIQVFYTSKNERSKQNSNSS